MNTSHPNNNLPPEPSTPTPRAIRLAREKALFLYWSALERGDLETCERVLQLAAQDAQLERLIIEAHQLDNAQQQETSASEVSANEVQDVRELAAQIFSSPLLSNPDSEAVEIELPPLTVAEVAARMRADAAQGVGNLPPEADFLNRLSRLNAPVPDKMTPRGVRRFLESLSVAASEKAQRAFRETAIFLQMGRQQNMAQMAATRRTRQSQNWQKSQQPPTAPTAPTAPTDEDDKDDKDKAHPDL